MEVPPMISVIGKIAKLLFGHTEFAVRFFPALIGAISIILIGVMVSNMSGKKYAQLIAGFGFLISPAFLGSNNLFQPVSFNQFMWLLSAFMMVRIVKENLPVLLDNFPLSSNFERASRTSSSGSSKSNLEAKLGDNLKLSPNGNNWYWLGIIAGLGFLTKYSILFFFTAMIGAYY